MSHVATSLLDYGSDGRVGLLLPSGNRAAEPQLRAMLPQRIGMAVTRLKLVDASEKSLLEMARNVEIGAELLADAGVDIIVFHCTAVSTYSVDLETSILARIESAVNTKSIATSQALVAGLHSLRAQRLVMLSPYSDEVNSRETSYFEAHGFEVLRSGGRPCVTAEEMMQVTPEEWFDVAQAHKDENADAYVLSCTTTRSSEVVERLEAELGRPVITSNTAVAYACMREMGFQEPIHGFGSLLRAG